MSTPEGSLEKPSHNSRAINNFRFKVGDDTFRFKVGDATFIAPDDATEKPKVAIIKRITEDSDGELMVLCQYLYRPEDVADRYGRKWARYDDRELFYSFHQEEVEPMYLMHTCVVHFVPSADKIPVRTQNPGFFVLRVYDTEEQVMWWITDRDFEKDRQVDIDHLLLKTQQLLGFGFEEEEKDVNSSLEEEKAVNSLEEGEIMETPESEIMEEETPESEIMEEEVEDDQSYLPVRGGTSDVDAILARALTGDDVRDKWLGMLFEEINSIAYRSSRDHHPKVVMSALVALEKACFITRGENLGKYQQKMRQMRYNLTHSVELTRRLIDRELEASAVLEMTAEELRKGLLAREEEPDIEEPGETHMEMADIPCSRCNEKRVGVHSNILKANRVAGYQLECLKCGKTWFSPSL